MRIFFIFILFALYWNEANAQNKQQSSYGGLNSDLAVSVSVLGDNSIITFSTSNSFSNNKDLLLSRIHKNGNVKWSKIYGGSNIETAVHMEKTSDQGYILLGNTISYGSGNEDIYLIKTDSSGNAIWSKTYGGSSGDFSGCVKEVAGGGYIIAGRTQSFGEGSDDGYLVRIDEDGDVIWSRSYGTNNNERFYYVECTSDNGFIVSGIQKNFSNYFDQLVVKFNEDGNIEFSKNIGDAGGSGNDAGDCIKQTSDGGYILCGQYRAFGSGGEDLGLTKIDSSGLIEWSKVYGNNGDDRAFDIAIDQSGNYLLAGYTNSFGLGGFDGFLVKVNQEGSVIWYKTYGYISDDYFAEIEISQNGYVMAGYTNSFGLGIEDIFIVKTDFDGLDNISCININVIENNISPIETDITQLMHLGGTTSSPNISTDNVIIGKSNLLNVSQPNVDSVYFVGAYQVPLETVPSVGSFKVDGVTKSYFQPSITGSHLIKFEYEIVTGCIYSYEKSISVVDICKYKIEDVPIECEVINNRICIPLVLTSDIGNGVLGAEYCLSYPSFMKPSGSFSLSNVVTHGNLNWVVVAIDSIDINKIRVSINYNNNAPAQTTFSGTGEIICIEFELLETIPVNSQHSVLICGFKELHDLFEVPSCCKSGSVFLSGNYNIKGSVFYRENNFLLADIKDDILASITIITQDSSNFILDRSRIDQFSEFKISSKLNSKLLFAVNLDEIRFPHLLLKYRNGFDAFQMEHIVTNKIGAPLQIEPSAFTMVAADVDISDKIRSNDISLLQEVIVKKIEGFPQQLPASIQQDYLDWRFIDKRSVDREESFMKASQYPYYSSKGYCRDNVPDIPFYLSNQGSCDTSYRETYHAIFLGDLVDGGSGVSVANFDNKSSSITLDIDDVHDLGNNTYRVFLNHTLNAQDKFVALDFALDYNESALSIVNTQITVEDKQTPQWLHNNYNSEELLFTSYSMNGYPLSGNLLYIDVEKSSGKPTIEDLGNLYVFANGVEVPSSIRLRSQTSTGIDIANDITSFVNLYPNPTDANLTVSLPLLYAKDVHVELMNSIGQSVLVFDNQQATSEIELDLSSLPAGLYECLISVEDKATVIKKVIVK